MNVKRYFVDDMQEVMGKVREELGSDAVILSSKRVRRKGIKGFFSKPVYEVMVAYDERVPPPKSAPIRTSLPKNISSAPQQKADKPKQAAPGGGTLSTAALSAALPAYQRTAQGGPAKTNTPAAPAPLSPALPKPPVWPQATLGTKNVPEKQEEPVLQPVSFPKVTMAAMPVSGGQGLDQRIERMDEEMSQIRKLLGQVVSRLSDSPAAPHGSAGFSSPWQGLYERLLAQEVEPALAQKLIHQAQAALQSGQAADARQALMSAILTRVRRAKPLLAAPGKQRVVLMVGPTGVGKTTTLVKLAAQAVIRDGMTVGMINADTFRIGAEQQLKTYAEILEAPVHMAYSAEDITALITKMRDLDMIFIDTPGKRPGDAQHAQEITRILQLCQPDAVYLVVCAPTSAGACRRIIEEYGFLPGYDLIVTKLDETESAGIVLTACEASGRGIAYIASGQSVPDDLSLADPQQIAALLTEVGK